MTFRYYTDPLAASWMAKHFGMEFHTGGGDFCTMTLHVAPSVYKEKHSGLNADRWYIYPGSLYLLEPRIGDLMTNIGMQAWRLTGICADRLLFLNGDGDTWLGRKAEMRTMERDGKPFFWPESEPA